MSISGISAYQSQNIFATNNVSGIKTSNRQSAPTGSQSDGDTVNISLDAKMLADIAAKSKEWATALEDGSAQLKMFGDSSYNPMTDVAYIPEAVLSYMPKLPNRIATLADLENYNKGSISNSEWTKLKQGVVDSHTALAEGAKAMSNYKKAMHQLGIDYNAHNVLYTFSKDIDQMKAADELFQSLMGA